MRWREGLICPACGHRGFCKLVRLTAGPVFPASKRPLTTWFAAIYHLTRSKGGIRSIELARRLGVRQPTAPAPAAAGACSAAGSAKADGW